MGLSPASGLPGWPTYPLPITHVGNQTLTPHRHHFPHSPPSRSGRRRPSARCHRHCTVTRAPGANAVLDALVPVAHAGALQPRPSPLPQARASPWPCHREARGYRAPFISPTCPRASLATAASPALTGPSREPLHRPQRRRHQPAAACIAAIDSLRQALPEPALAHLQAHCEPLFLSPLLPSLELTAHRNAAAARRPTPSTAAPQ